MLSYTLFSPVCRTKFNPLAQKYFLKTFDLRASNFMSRVMADRNRSKKIWTNRKWSKELCWYIAKFLPTYVLVSCNLAPLHTHTCKPLSYTEESIALYQYIYRLVLVLVLLIVFSIHSHHLPDEDFCANWHRMSQDMQGENQVKLSRLFLFTLNLLAKNYLQIGLNEFGLANNKFPLNATAFFSRCFPCESR